MHAFALPRLDHPNQVRLLWQVDFYDGVISGVADFDGRLHWFVCQNPERNHRVFHLFELTADESAVELHTHRLFREHVGEHTDYTYDPVTGKLSRAVGALRPQEEWVKFYDRPTTPGLRSGYSDRPAVGWFELSASPHNRRARSIRYWSRRSN